MFFDLFLTISHVKIQLFVTFKSAADPDSDPDPYWFGSLDPDLDPH